MKSTLLRTVAFLLLTVFLLSAFAGCNTDDTPTNTVTSTDTKAEDVDNTPTEPIDLNNYFIILPDGAIDSSVESLSAYELKEELSKLGYSVRVRDDGGSADVDPKSILIGKTAATTGEMPAGNQYTVSEKDGQIQISAGNYYAYTAAIKFVKNKIKQNNGFPRGLEHTATTTVANAKRATEDSVRVMFYNVFGMSIWQKTVADAQGNKKTQNVTGNLVPPSAMRQALQVDMIKTFAPDVIGFQEFTGDNVASHLDYQGDFSPYLTEILGYAQIKPEVGSTNCTPLYYNPDKLDVVKSDYVNFAVGDDSKGVTWAVFSVKSGKDAGKTFAVFNTHFAYEAGEEGDTRREQNANEILGVINEATENGKIAAFMGGDLNFWNVWKNYDTASSRKPYEALVNGGMTLVSNLPDVKTNFWTSSQSNYTNSYHGYYEYDATKKIYDTENSTLSRLGKAKYTLDFIFLRNQSQSTVSVKQYVILEDALTLRASDHSPTLMDFVLK